MYNTVKNRKTQFSCERANQNYKVYFQMGALVSQFN